MSRHGFVHDGDARDYYGMRYCVCRLPEANWQHQPQPSERGFVFALNNSANVLPGEPGDSHDLGLPDAVVGSLGDLLVEPASCSIQGRLSLVVRLRRRFQIRRHRDIMRPSRVAR